MNILFLGGDTRYKLMMKDLSKRHSVSYVGFCNIDFKVSEADISSLDLSKFDIVLFPISGLNDNMEIKTEKGPLVLPESIFRNLNCDTIFFTGLKTSKLTELISSSQLISFLDYPEVEKINNELTVLGTIAKIQDLKKDSVCILGYGVLGKEIYLRLKSMRSKNVCYIKTKRTYLQG